MAIDNNCNNCGNCSCDMGQERNDRRLIRNWLISIANHIIRSDLRNKRRPLTERRKQNEQLG